MSWRTGSHPVRSGPKGAFFRRALVDYAAVAVRGNGNVASKVHHDQPQLVIGPLLLTSESAGHCFDVERVADRRSFDKR
jgi:hypothetical protein